MHMNNHSGGKTKEKQGHLIVLCLLVFFAGLLNSQDYIVFMGLYSFNSFLIGMFYPLLILVIYVYLINTLYKKNDLTISASRYYGLMIGIVLFKLVLIFIQNPSSFLPDEKMYSTLIAWTGSFLLMIVLSIGIRSLKHLKIVTLSFGIGASFSAIIPLLFFPEMIGTREIVVDGYKFGGAFWNSTLISFFSVGWILVATNSLINSRIVKVIQVVIFLILMITSLAGLSRSALLSVAFSILVYLLTLNKFTKYLKWVVLIFFSLILIFPLFQDSIEIYQERFDRDIEDEPRTAIWLDYLEDLPDYIWLGEPEGNHIKYSVTNQGPHSAVLNWLTQYGIFGLVGFLLVLVGILTSINNVRKYYSKESAAALYAWLTSYLSVALINETGFNEMTVFGAFGIIFAWSNIIRNKKVSKRVGN